MKVNKGYTLIEVMIVIAIVAILAATLIPAYQEAETKDACKDKGGTLVERLTGEIRNGNSVKEYHCELPKPVAKVEKPVNIKVAKESPQYIEWGAKVKGCPKAESRLKTYMYSGKPLGEYEKNDIDRILVKTCQQTLTE